MGILNLMNGHANVIEFEIVTPKVIVEFYSFSLLKKRYCFN